MNKINYISDYLKHKQVLWMKTLVDNVRYKGSRYRLLEDSQEWKFVPYNSELMPGYICIKGHWELIIMKDAEP